MALLILALLQRIFLMSSLMLLLVWLIFFMVLIKLLPILGTISGKTVKLDRKSGSAGMPRPISYAVFCLKKKTIDVDVIDIRHEGVNEAGLAVIADSVVEARARYWAVVRYLI